MTSRMTLSGFYRLFAALLIISTGSVFAAAEEIRANLVWDGEAVCSNCQRYHKDESHGFLAASFSAQIGNQVPSRLTIGFVKPSNDGRQWSFDLKKENEVNAEPGTRRWQDQVWVVTYAEGVLSVFVRGLTVTNKDVTIPPGKKFVLTLDVFSGNTSIAQRYVDVVTAEKSKNDDVKFWNAVDDSEVPFKTVRALKTADVVAKSPDFSLTSYFKYQQGPQGIYVIVPIYREFYNQNIGALLVSLASQISNPFGPDVHIVFNVNNTQNVDSKIRTENEETVAYLRKLSEGQVPTVRPESEVLRQAIFKVLASGIKIHVMDHTNPGYQHRNIGVVRDDAFKFVLNKIPADQLDKVIVTQMDGDSRVPADYLQRLYEAFSDEKIKYALLSMKFGTERNSSLQTYRRMIMAEIWFAGYAFYDAASEKQPVSGSPRIAARAQAMKDIGGVPHEKMGEDTVLVRNLKNNFPNQGKWLSDLSVEVSFRGREDGYDAAYYLKRMNEPVALEERELETLKAVEAAEKDFDKVEELKRYRQARLVEILAQREKDVRARLALLLLNIAEVKKDGQLITRDHRIDLGLYSTAEFEAFLKKTLQEHKGDEAATVKAIAEQFPHILKVKPPKESIVLARIVAATDTYLSKNSVIEMAKKGQGLGLNVDMGCVPRILALLAL